MWQAASSPPAALSRESRIVELRRYACGSSALATTRDRRSSIPNLLGNRFLIEVISEIAPMRRVAYRSDRWKSLGNEMSGFVNDICRD